VHMAWSVELYYHYLVELWTIDHTDVSVILRNNLFQIAWDFVTSDVKHNA
jgi:hypothetical protein